MSCGIAAAGAAAAGIERPVPLPAQALDHGTGYLLAAAVVRALTDRLATGRPADITASLLGTANLLQTRPVTGRPRRRRVPSGPTRLVDVVTAWGPAGAVPSAGDVAGWPASYGVPAGPLGRDAAAW